MAANTKINAQSDVLKQDLASFFKLGTVAPKTYEKVVVPEDNDGYVLPKGVVESGTGSTEVSERMNRQKIKSAFARLEELHLKKRRRETAEEDDDEKDVKGKRAKRAKMAESDSDESGSDSGSLSDPSEADSDVDMDVDGAQHDDEGDEDGDSDSEAGPEVPLTEEEQKALKKRLARQAARHRKAEAKAAAKAALNAAMTGEDGAPTKLKRKKLTEAQQTEIGARTLFVGNMPINADKKAVKKLFEQYGKVESVRFRNITVNNPESRLRAVIKKDFHPERDSMVAYVVFDSEASVAPAMKANGVEFGGKHLRVDSSSKSSPTVRDYTNCIFISKLPFGAEEEDLREIFQRCGTISSIRIIRDKQYKVAKGFGYVRFTNSEGLNAALKLNNKITYKENVLLIAKALPPPSVEKDARAKRSSSRTSTTSLAQKYKSKSKKFSGIRQR
jgi:nucleolar protein 12